MKYMSGSFIFSIVPFGAMLGMVLSMQSGSLFPSGISGEAAEKASEMDQELANTYLYFMIIVQTVLIIPLAVQGFYYCRMST